MGIFEWGEKRFARGIAKAMIRSYILFKKDDPSLDEVQLTRCALSTRPGVPAKELLHDMGSNDFWITIAGSRFTGVIYLLVRMEYIEYMNGTVDAENEATNMIFKKIITEEIEKAKPNL